MADVSGSILRYVADLLRVAVAASALVALVRGELGGAIRFGLALVVLLLARRRGLLATIDVVLGGALLFEGWANLAGWYADAWWIDVVVHFVLGGAAGAAVYIVLSEELGVDDPLELARADRRPTAIVFSVAAASTLGVLWELYEWFAHSVGQDIYVSYEDTLLDLTMDMSGAVAVVALVLARDHLRSSARSPFRS